MADYCETLQRLWEIDLHNSTQSVWYNPVLRVQLEQIDYVITYMCIIFKPSPSNSH